jgi:hypothetical protein
MQVDADVRGKHQAAEAAKRREAVAMKPAMSAAIDDELQRREQSHGAQLDSVLAADRPEIDRLFRVAYGPAGGMRAASFRRRRASGQAMARSERLDLLRGLEEVSEESLCCAANGSERGPPA